MKILIVFGTRPEAIKLAPLIQTLKQHFEIKVCVSAQHRQMLDQILALFNITPDFDLNIMQVNQSLSDITARILQNIDQVLTEVQPDLVIVQGDTSTTFSTALASFYRRIPVAHVEAGLRTYNKYSPFPEEINRQITTRIAALHFAPTQSNYNNLINEGVSKNKIIITGNTVIDALLTTVKQSQLDIEQYLNIDLQNKRVLLVTGHRRENFGSGFENICLALKTLANEMDTLEIIYPVHLNPNVRQPVNALLSGIRNIHLIEPLDYEPFVKLMQRADLILTDSGGVQEEAPSLGKPVLVMRDTTERPEGVLAKTVSLTGTDSTKIICKVKELLTNTSIYESMAKAHNPYGDGQACNRILQALLDYFNQHNFDYSERDREFKFPT